MLPITVRKCLHQLNCHLHSCRGKKTIITQKHMKHSCSPVFILKRVTVMLWHGVQLGCYICTFQPDISIFHTVYFFRLVCLIIQSSFIWPNYSYQWPPLGGRPRHWSATVLVGSDTNIYDLQTTIFFRFSADHLIQVQCCIFYLIFPPHSNTLSIIPYKKYIWLHEK